MARRLNRNPRRVKTANDSKDHWWWYEENGHISILHEVRVGDRWVRTDAATIGARQLRSYLARHDEAK